MRTCSKNLLYNSKKQELILIPAFLIYTVKTTGLLHSLRQAWALSDPRCMLLLPVCDDSIEMSVI